MVLKVQDQVRGFRRVLCYREYEAVSGGFRWHTRRMFQRIFRVQSSGRFTGAFPGV